MDEKKGEAILPEEPQTETAAEESPKGFTRRQVVAGGIGVGLVGLIAGGALAKWGVIEDTIASGRVAVNVTPTKLIVTDRARCSGCQRCEMMCSLRNDGRVCQTTARVRVWPNYNFGEGSNGPDGIYRNCQFTVEHCKQCKDAACMKNCPVHAIYADPETGARGVDTDKCIGCGLCAKKCPVQAIEIQDKRPVWVKDRCVMCLGCLHHCPKFAIQYDNRTKKHGQYTNPVDAKCVSR